MKSQKLLQLVSRVIAALPKTLDNGEDLHWFSLPVQDVDGTWRIEIRSTFHRDIRSDEVLNIPDRVTFPITCVVPYLGGCDCGYGGVENLLLAEGETLTAALRDEWLVKIGAGNLVF